MPITITIAGRSGTASDFIGGLCSEHLVFAGDPLTLPAKVALLDLDGTTLAAADLQANDSGAVTADLSTDTQQIADRYRYQPTDTLNRATLFIGDDATLQAVIPVSVKKNWLDDSAVHPPAPAERYPTIAELEKWLKEAGAIAGNVTSGATRAEQAATNAQNYASGAAGASISAAKSYENAEASRKAADSAAQVARDARENAQLQQQQATAAAGKANGYRQQAENAQRLATRAKESAEAAQQAAEEAQAAAGTSAANAAQSAADARQKADEANQAATAATTAASNLDEAVTAAESAKTAAETAKAAAESAKAAAESAKAQAATSATAAAGSAANAASSAEEASTSATAAQESAEGLQEGLATLNTLDGRVTFLESGEGIYKDPTTGKVTTFTPLPGSDGTLKVIKELPNFYKVTPMEESLANTDTVVTSDGQWFVIGVVDHLYFYDASLNRLGKWKSPYCRMDYVHRSTGSGRYALWEHTDGHLRCVTQDNSALAGNPTIGKIYLYDVTAGAVLKSVTKPFKASWHTNESIYNLASGHILTRHDTQKKEDGTNDFFWLLWDADLNPIVDEATGEQKRIDANAVFDKDGVYTAGKLFESTPVRVMQMASEGKTLITSTRYFDWGDRGNNVGLWTFGADDLPIQIMEHAPVEDPENPGYCQCEKNEDGTIKREWDDDRNCYFPRLVTQEIGPATFKKAYPAEYGLSAGGNGNGVSGLPFMMRQSNAGYYSMIRDNCFRYILTHDNKLINTAFAGNNRIATAVRQPAFTYKFPLAQAANYGKYKFPASASDFMNILLPAEENTAVLYAANTGKDNINLMARSGNWNFIPDIYVRYPFSPLTLNQYGGVAATLKSGGMTFFGVPTWCTNKMKIIDGVL